MSEPVLVVWDDAASRVDGPAKLMRRRTVGWVSKKTKRKLVVRMTKDESGEAATSWAIPRSQVISITPLHV